MSRAGASAPASASGRDVAWCLGLVALSVACIARLPYDLGDVDEGLFLYEAKRLLTGDVFYRDVFDIVTPGAHYLMAALFALFGADIATARIAMAVLHGVTVACTYLAARHLGVGRGLAVLAGIAHLALCQPVWTVSSPHWVSTTLTLVLLLVLIARPDAAVLPGVLCGVLVLVQQHHGAATTAGVATVLVADALLGIPGVFRRLVRFAGGLALAAVPGFVALAAIAGPMTLAEALVLQPLRDYAAYHQRTVRPGWGVVVFMTRQQVARTVPVVLRWLPLVLVVDLVRGGLAWRAGDTARLRMRVRLALFTLFAMVSIANLPDIIHIGFIGAVFFVGIADHTAWVLRRLPDGPVRRVGRGMVTVALAAALGWQLVRVPPLVRAAVPVAHDTAFGRVDLGKTANADVVDLVRARLDAVPGREFFCYPACPALYLMADAWNPTPYQLLMPLYSPARQLEQVLATLTARRTPLVAIVTVAPMRDDPVVAYIKAHYRSVNNGFTTGIFVMERDDTLEPHAQGGG